MSQKLPWLTYFFILLSLFGFFVLFLGDELGLSSDPYPNIGKVAIFTLSVGILGVIEEIIRDHLKQR